MNTPRYPVVSNLLDACREKAPIKVWNAADIGVTTDEIGLEGSYTNVIKTFAPKSKRAGEVLEGDTKTQVKTLIGKLKDNLLV